MLNYDIVIHHVRLSLRELPERYTDKIVKNVLSFFVAGYSHFDESNSVILCRSREVELGSWRILEKSDSLALVKKKYRSTVRLEIERGMEGSRMRMEGY